MRKFGNSQRHKYTGDVHAPDIVLFQNNNGIGLPLNRPGHSCLGYVLTLDEFSFDPAASPVAGSPKQTPSTPRFIY